ncbi:carbohydrate ABC transporter permease [Streptomyces litchfieldiae]|uniref:Carbohydrate ABC transporter permease n=1 Tax=Streptomyces litchfieldiae TaxID=3075543 RepID=A0ABU2MYT7_9ACTN|nr:carbohydrate ABC transporter permease [Streptomyces sp. DSM 44938]MDT0346818.1 carbohydrate ABC transporter permease [Streptomyces sp. DSM 44938]
MKINTPRLALYTALVLITGLLLGPFGWLILTALKAPDELAALPIRWLPENFQWHNFGDAWDFINYLGYARNSLIIATIYAVTVTIASAWVGFGFARLSAPGKRPMFGLLLSTMMLPQIITLIPTYLVFARLGMVNTYWPWVLWGLSGAPFLIFLFRQFFVGMPRELEEAAIVDGCSYTGIFFRIFLPQSWPAIAASLVISFGWTWGDFIAPTLLLSQDKTTLAVILTTAYRDAAGNPLNNLVAAGAVMYVLPPLLLFLVAQRGFVAGISTSGLK